MMAILGGTSFCEAEEFSRGASKRVVTPHGSCLVRVEDEVVLIARHGEAGKIPPHRINHHAHLSACARLGVGAVVSFGSVGGLRLETSPGTLLLVDDYFAPFRVTTFHDDRIRFAVPEIDQPWRIHVLNCLRAAGLKCMDGGVYVETLGPCFESRAEIGFLSRVGDVVGMTCASEFTLAMELGIAHATVVMVDNYANGLDTKPLTGEGFRLQVKQNRRTVLQAFRAIYAMAES